MRKGNSAGTRKHGQFGNHSPAPGRNHGERTTVPDETTGDKACGWVWLWHSENQSLHFTWPAGEKRLQLADGEEKQALAGGRRYETQAGSYRAGTDKKRRPRKHRMYFPAEGEEKLSKADQIFLQNCKDILQNGVWDTDGPVRPKWEDGAPDRKSTRLNSSHNVASRMPSSA